MAKIDDIIAAAQLLQESNIDLEDLKGKMPGPALGLVGKAFGAEQALDMVSARGNIEQQIIRAKGEEARATAAAREQAKLTANAALGDILERVTPVAATATTVTPELAATLGRIRSLPGGEAAAKGLEAMIGQNLERETLAKVDELKKIVQDAGGQVDDESLAKAVRNRLERGADLDSVKADLLKQVPKQRRETRRQKVIKVLSEANVKNPDKQAAKLIRMKPPERKVAINQLIQSAERATAAKSVGAKALGAGIGAAVLVGLGKKLLGGGGAEQGPALPPEMQMALMAKLQKSQADSERENGLRQGRDVRNLAATLGVVKMLQDMAGMGNMQPSVARVV